jgi:PAS domain S-box-containing protein
MTLKRAPFIVSRIRSSGAFLFSSQREDVLMAKKPTYEEAQQRIRKTDQKAVARKQIEETLGEREEKYGIILESIEDGYYEVDIAGDFTFFNDSLCEIMGYTRDELMGMNNRHYMDGETARKVYKSYNKVYTTGKPDKGFEYEMIRKDGTSKNVEVSISLIKDSEGQRIGFRGTVRDVTKRKRAEEALEQKISQLNSFIDNIPDMAWLKDADSRFIAVNKAFGEAVGMEPESLLNHTCEVCFEKEAAKKFREDDLKVMKGRRQVVIEEKILDSEKNEIWLETIKSPIINESGKAIGTVGIARDVSDRKGIEEALRKARNELEKRVEGRTAELSSANVHLKRQIAERKQAEEALRESEQKYGTLVENSLIGIYIDQDGKIVFANRRFAEIYGYSKKESAGMESWRLVHPDDRALTDEMRAKRLGGKKAPREYEARGLTKDGETIWIVRRNTRIEYKGRPAVLGNIAEITDHKRAEEEKSELQAQLQQAQRMETIGTLAGGIAHDFNNLLMGIQGNVSLMYLEMDPDHPYYERLRNIEKQIQSGARLTSHLLGYARKGKYEVRPINLNELVGEACETFVRTKKDITVDQELSEDLFAIDADSGQIEQVLLNLCVNAADAMPDGGNLIVKTMNTNHKKMKSKLYNPKAGDYVQLTVTDTGIGMDKKTAEHIFDPFFTTKERGHGTGLGLASAYGIVKAHGGHIDVKSKRGHGTAFSIYLPASEKRAQQVVKTAGEVIEGTGTVLLVDDEEVILEVGQDLLEAMGYRVLIARDGKEAVKVYKKDWDEIDAVVMDMVMPNMGGGEAYDRIKEINPNGFIQKPFNMKKLAGKIVEILAEE